MSKRNEYRGAKLESEKKKRDITDRQLKEHVEEKPKNVWLKKMAKEHKDETRK